MTDHKQNNSFLLPRSSTTSRKPNSTSSTWCSAGSPSSTWSCAWHSSRSQRAARPQSSGEDLFKPRNTCAPRRTPLGSSSPQLFYILYYTIPIRYKVAQDILSKDLTEQIIKELGSPQQARSCMELLEVSPTHHHHHRPTTPLSHFPLTNPHFPITTHYHTRSQTCVSFIMATGGSIVQKLDIGDRFLGDYAKTVSEPKRSKA